MSNHKEVINLIKAVSGQANILTIPRLFVDFTGSLDRGLLLSQILYWSDKSNDPNGWFYKTYADWKAEICLSEYQVRENIKELIKLGFLETKVKKAPNGNPTVHYRLDWDKFSASFLADLQKRNQRNLGNESQESGETLKTEITSKTTSKAYRVPPHPSIEAFKCGMGRYPVKNHWSDIMTTVGEDEADLALWEQVVRGWKLTGWNPNNTGGMLDYFRRREIPATKPSQKGVKSNGRATTETAKPRSQVSAATSGSTDRDLLKAHLERKHKSG